MNYHPYISGFCQPASSTLTVVAGAVLTAERKFARQSVFSVTVAARLFSLLYRASRTVGTGPVCRHIRRLHAGGVVRACDDPSSFAQAEILRKQPQPVAEEYPCQWPPLVTAGVVVSGCVVVDQTMAVLAGEGAVAMINFGNRVTLGLLSLVAVIWTVLFPHFIDKVVKRQYRELTQSFSRLIVVILLGGLCVCSGLALASEWMTRFIYERGAFSAEDTLIVADIQALYLLHIPFYMVVVGCGRIMNALEKQQHFLWVTRCS